MNDSARRAYGVADGRGEPELLDCDDAQLGVTHSSPLPKAVRSHPLTWRWWHASCAPVSGPVSSRC